MPEERRIMAEDVREIRRDIGELHNKLDGYAQRQTEMLHKMELRVTVIEQKPDPEPVPERPCPHFVEHKDWHKTEAVRAEKNAAKWQDRIWDLFVKYFPTLAALAVAGYAVKKGG